VITEPGDDDDDDDDDDIYRVAAPSSATLPVVTV